MEETGAVEFESPHPHGAMSVAAPWVLPSLSRRDPSGARRVPPCGRWLVSCEEDVGVVAALGPQLVSDDVAVVTPGEIAWPRLLTLAMKSPMQKDAMIGSNCGALNTPGMDLVLTRRTRLVVPLRSCRRTLMRLLPPTASPLRAGCGSLTVPLVAHDSDQVAPPSVELGRRMWLGPCAPPGRPRSRGHRPRSVRRHIQGAVAGVHEWLRADVLLEGTASR
jgi:hypothetical protein